MKCRWPHALLIFAVVVGGCHPIPPESPAPLRQRGYLWQRAWTPAVANALTEAKGKLDGVVILGAEILWTDGKPVVVRAAIPWDSLRSEGSPYSVALRIAPFPGPFAPDDRSTRAIVETAKSLLDEAARQGVKLAEFQVDFDCTQRTLAGYRVWLTALRQAIRPELLVLTVLPAWLNEPDFRLLIREADGYVLQVHSVPTLKETGRATLCDPALVRRWTEKAARLGVPFSIALPTYRCLAGYAPTGKLLGVVMDSVQPAWPAGTQLLEFSTNADELAELVNEWRKDRPTGLREIIWYRIPVTTDRYNWRWPTLSAVMAGKKPAHRLEVIQQGSNPIDLSIVNTGEAEAQFTGEVTMAWNAGNLVASDALSGWRLQTDEHHAVFRAEPGPGWRLSPGETRSIGWLRYDHVPTIRSQIAPGRN